MYIAVPIVHVAACTADMIRFLPRRSVHSQGIFRCLFCVPKYVLAHLDLRVRLHRIVPRVTTGDKKCHHLPLCYHAYFFRRSPVRAVLRFTGEFARVLRCIRYHRVFIVLSREPSFCK